MLEAVCVPDHMHEEGGDDHGNIYDSDSDERNCDEYWYYIGVFTLEANGYDLEHSDE